MIFTLHMKPSNKDVGDESYFDDLVAVPDGLAKWAILFAPFWLVFHRLWFALAIYLLTTVLIIALLGTPLIPIPLLLSGLPGLYLFLEGYQLKRNKLEREGYELKAVVDAENKQSAIEKFLHTWEPEPMRTSTQVVFPNPSGITPARSNPSFGLFFGDEA